MSFQPLDPDFENKIQESFSRSTLSICRPEVFVVKNGVKTLCAAALMTLMALHGKPDRPGEDSERRGQKFKSSAGEISEEGSR